MDYSNTHSNSYKHVLAVFAGAFFLVAAAIAGAIGGFSAARATAVPPPLSLPVVTKQAGFADLVATVRPAVVNISTTHVLKSATLPQLDDSAPFGNMLKQFFGPNAGQSWQRNTRPSHALGSGFVIDASGYVVTNNHVIDDATTIRVTLSDGNVYPASVVGRDAKTDLALLKIKADKPLPYVAFGDSTKERVGDWVIAVGNPYGLGGSVSAGVVSALNRDINHGPYDDYLQIDAPINPGNSGGPLFDQSGYVIGVDTAIFSPSGGSVGIGFAIPSSVARDVIDQLRAHGRVNRGWLGVQMQAVTPGLAKAVGLSKPEGVLVDLVTKGSPADKAGLKQGDVITRFGSTAIASTKDLALAVADTASGQTESITAWREGHEHELQVTIAGEPTWAVASAAGEPEHGQLGLELASVSPEGSSGLDRQVGAVVAGVTPGSPADKSGIQPGDEILAIGTHKVTSLEETTAQIQIAESKNKRAILLLVRRGDESVYIPIELGSGRK